MYFLSKSNHGLKNMRFYKLEAVVDGGGSCVFSSFGSSGWLCVLYCIEMKFVIDLCYVLEYLDMEDVFHLF